MQQYTCNHCKPIYALIVNIVLFYHINHKSELYNLYIFESEQTVRWRFFVKCVLRIICLAY